LNDYGLRAWANNRAEWPSRDQALTHWRNLCIAAAVSRVIQHGFHATRGRDKHGKEGSQPYACSIVADLVSLNERTVEAIWTAHREVDTIEEARYVLKLSRTVT
jgi:hypothetical protein